MEDLDELGRALNPHLWHERSIADACLLDVVELLTCAVELMGQPLTPHAALELVMSELARRSDTGDLAASSVQRIGRHLARFTADLHAVRGVTDIRDVGRSEALSFIERPERDGTRPKASTRDNRRYAVSLYFAALRTLGLYPDDPLAEVRVARDDVVSLRPLTHAEVATGRLHAPRSIRDLRGPGAWALAEATATTSEIPLVLPEDLDLDHCRVWLTGGARNEPRWGALSPWGTEALGRLVSADPPPGRPLLCSRTADAQNAQISASQTIHGILRRAGIGADPRVRPGSIPAWAGRTLYDTTGDLVSVTRSLGLRSLDDAARTIGLHWHARDIPPTHRGS
jgi:hypothetical protein